MKPSDLLLEHAKVCQGLKAADIEALASPILASLKAGGKVLICGNGGSAADAQHFAAELSGRYIKERKALPGIALTTDTSALTAISNDYGFGRVFARQVEALGKRGDVLVLLSTSGDSENLLEAAKAARAIGIQTVALLGKGGGRLKPMCDKSLVVASDSTPTIQEMHILIIHCICGLVDDAFSIRPVPHRSG
ncbi:MAG: D-sedoheptulose 7-phosphate isomerase [Candidatus ainarchaeum sp.]|nr:D-sedoheptulose 7-phosphate isomerase [Candidatus ainarchaeum sp.]